MEKAAPGLANSSVVSIHDDVLSAPGGIVQEYGLEESLFSEESGLFVSPREPSVLMVYSRIDNSSYYVEWHADTLLSGEADETVNYQEIMLRPEAACGGYALIVKDDPAAAEGYRFLYKNSLFSAFDTLEGIGLTMDGIREHSGLTKMLKEKSI